MSPGWVYTSRMEMHGLSALLAPLGAAAFIGAALAIKLLVARHLPPRIRDVLLRDLFPSGLSESSRQVRERAQRLDAAAGGGRDLV